MSQKNNTFYVITYRDPQEEKIVSLKVKTIKDSDLGLSFISISDFLFEESSLVIDPKAEKLRTRFENTKNFHLSIYSIISIEEVGHEHLGLCFERDKSNLFMFPSAPNTK